MLFKKKVNGNNLNHALRAYGKYQNMFFDMYYPFQFFQRVQARPCDLVRFKKKMTDDAELLVGVTVMSLPQPVRQA